MRECKVLEGYEMYGWKPDESLENDDNFMDIVMLLTRNSKLKQGSMACVLVEPDSQKPDNSSIISVATNQSLYTENDSDVHAEIAALGGACRNGKTTENATYVDKSLFD